MRLSIVSKRNFILIIIILFSLILPIFVTNDYYKMLFNQTFINIIAVLGLNFITGLTGQMNLGTDGLVAIGAYSSALLTTTFKISPWLGIVFALVMGLIIGIGLGYPSLKIKGIYLALTTLGFGEIVRMLITNLNFTGGTHGISNIPGYNFFGISINSPTSFYYFLLFVVIFIIYISLRIVNSKWGRTFKAIRDNAEAVEACGIDISKLKILAFTLASIYGALAGALYGNLMGYINPTAFNYDLSVSYIMMMMIGGIGSVTGNILGAIVVTILPEILRFLQNYYWLFFSTVVLIFTIFVPNGLISIFEPFSKVIMKTKEVKNSVNNFANK